MRKLITFGAVFASLVFVPQIMAQDTTYWSSCSDGVNIVHCETYNCPNGDTNTDGRCTITDKGAELTESRKDSFCANPVSGCGEVLYFGTNQSNSCAVRVKENTNNCNLYKASTPNFGSTTEITAPRATDAPVSRLTIAPVTSPKPIKSSTTLPKTGPALWISIIIAGLGVYGFHQQGKKTE